MGNKQAKNTNAPENKQTVDYKKLQDPKYQGEPMEDKSTEGPDKNRGCTDIICCFIYIAFIGGMVVIAYFGLAKGDPYRLSCPFNSYAAQCGFYNGTVNTTYLPFLYFPGTVASLLDLSTITNSLCIDKCPNSTADDLTTFTCYSNVQGKCNTLIAGNPVKPTYGSKGLFGRFCIPYDSNSAASLVSGVASDIFGRYMSDLISTWKALAVSVGTAFVLSMVYLLIVRCFARFIIWFTIIALLIGMVALATFCWYKYVAADANVGNDKNMYYGLAIAIWIISGLYLLIILCLAHKIAQAIRIISEAARFVHEKPSTIFVPIIMIVIAIGFLIFWVVMAVYVWSSGKFTYNGNPFASVEWDDQTRYSWWYHLFGLIWGECFIFAFLQFILAATVVQWYFSKDKSNSISIIKSIWWGVRYHLGSLAFGSLLLAIIIFVQIMFEYMRKKMQQANPNSDNYFVKCLLRIARCCLWCLNRFIRFLTSNAYVMVAISSKNFCLSCIKAFFLLLRNAFVFALVYVFGTVFIVLGEVSVAVANGIVGYLLIMYWGDMSSQVYSSVIPILFMGIIGLLMSMLFMYIYEMAIKAITQCFFTDLEIAERNKKAHVGKSGKMLDFKHKDKM